MLALAILGAAVSQAVDTGGRYYWLALVLIYAAISITRTYLRARDQAQSLWSMIGAQVLHWVGVLVAINIILLFESSGVSDRGPAADYSLLVLALSCYLAGVHFDWTFMLLGGILAVIAVGLGYLDQFSIYLVTIPLALLATWIVYKRNFASAG
ncbi:DUF5368 family protein [uncultured Lamprocystis sp.]|uniref:DUF5368 family protein n=1 Tax=uncultured Lamprocystis sp. TaxID=543132 RepID=UPI0025E9F041|nr:DUF5368 family protein [uncultured Lamprocystis sp.]